MKEKEVIQGVNPLTKLPEAKHVDPSQMAERERRQMVKYCSH